MKVTLLVPPSSMQERYGSFHEAGSLYPSLGLSYLAATAEKAGHQVTIIDAEATRKTFEDIKAELMKLKPDVIGMQTFCANIDRCYYTSRLAKETLGKVTIIFGGVQATLFPYEVLEHTEVDYVVYGEGDVTFVELLQTLEQNTSVALVKGIYWRNGATIQKNEPRPLIKDLDSLPMPALHLFPLENYHSSAQLRGNRTLHMFTSRGCPYHCAYCSGDLIFGRSFRFHSPERVVAELQRLKHEYQVDSIQFYDETFTVNRKRVITLCQRMIEARLNLEWTCFTRVDCVDEHVLREMKRAGCYQIFFGVETGVQRLLKMIDKATTLDQARIAFKLCRKIGIETVASFMLTLPTETESETWESVRFGLELDPDYVYWLTFTPYPGTRLAAIAQQSGHIKSLDYASYNVFNEIVYIPEGRTEEEIKRTLAKAYRRFYVRPRYMLRRLQSFRKLPPKKIRSLLIGGFRTFFKRRV